MQSDPPQGSFSTDEDLGPMEQGAINSILHVLRANPELIIPVMAAIEQHAAQE